MHIHPLFMFLYVELRKLFAKPADLRRIIHNDVKIVRMMDGIVLMIGLCRIERVEWVQFGDDSALEHFLFIELIDISLRDSLLVRGGKKDRRPVLRTYIRTLTVEFGWIVSDGEEDLKQRSVSNLRRIICDL